MANQGGTGLVVVGISDTEGAVGPSVPARLLLFLLVGLVVAACGGSGNDSGGAAPTTTTTAATTTTAPRPKPAPTRPR